MWALEEVGGGDESWLRPSCSGWFSIKWWQSHPQMTDVSSITRQGWPFWMKLTTTSLQVTDSWEQSGCSTSGVLLQEGGPFQGPKLGSCRTLGSELSEETHVWQSQRFYWERAPTWRAVGEGNPEQLCHTAHSLGFYGDGISFWVVFSQSFWLRVLLAGAHRGSAKMDAREKDSGRWSDLWCLLLTFPELFQLLEAC